MSLIMTAPKRDIVCLPAGDTLQSARVSDAADGASECAGRHSPSGPLNSLGWPPRES